MALQVAVGSERRWYGIHRINCLADGCYTDAQQI